MPTELDSDPDARPGARRARHGVLSVPFEKHVLPNGLQVVIHEDHRDPVVSVHVCYHVGSAREEPGKSGFAHLFEHMLFQGSRHVGDNEHFRLIGEAGGTLNGNTTTDRTLYFETLPSNQLELALWLESDRMGFLLPAMTQAKLDNQRDVVLNERRQNYENRPYGRAQMATSAALFPAGHPYSWPTIGSARDIRGATLDDVRAFFRRWYGPGNATLALGGDLDPDRALAAVERWFGGLPPGPPAPPMQPRPVRLPAPVRIHQEDRVQSPRLVMTWPTPEHGHPDGPALRLLAMILSQNKASVLDRALMVDAVLAREVFVLDWPGELAGRFSITATAAPGVALGAIEDRIGELLAGLDRDGIDPAALERMRNRQEADFVRGLETVSSRVQELALSNTLLGDPAAFLDEQAALAAVSADEVRRVLRRHLTESPGVVLSVVPEGRVELASGGAGASVPAPSDEAPGVETPPGAAATPATAGVSGTALARDPDDLDRGTRPPPAPTPAFEPPGVWHDRAAGGFEVVGVDLSGSPLLTFRLSLPGGRTLERPGQYGLSTLMAELIEEGTRALSTTELTERLDALGAGLWVRSGDDELSYTMTALERHLEPAAELLAEVVRSPRLAPADFERLRTLRLAAIDAREDRIQAVAHDVWRHLLRREGPLAAPALGSRASIAALTREDVERHLARHLDPAAAAVGARLELVGDLAAARARSAFRALREPWSAAPERGSHAPGGPLAAAAPSGAEGAAGPELVLVHAPGAAQSELRVGHLSVSSLDPDWYPLQVLNYVLGGNFNSRINLNLREDKGYTYGARSAFEGGLVPGAFTAGAAVHTEATAPALVELLGELERIPDGVTEAELDFARDALTQAQLRRYESSAARLALAGNLARFGWPDDYPARRLEVLAALTTDDLAELARRHLRPARFEVLVVGDRERVRADLEALGRGPVRELDGYGRPLGDAR